ncbi:MAG TPA: RNA polymerase sigma factor SigJ [Thermoanaerobaculia bacterium]|nr:RNA polymerase sigma factor SigJ [Thermoanaerobaculia bacterium]
MLSEFEAHRRLLFSVAYRMLGSAADAEDLVQDAWLRFAAADRAAIRDPKAFLVTIVTRLALDRLKSAQAQREEYIGPWLPEPVLTGDDAAKRVERDEQIELALLMMLERLSPIERGVFLLYDVLDHDHNEIAEALGITSAASRQHLHRARERVAEEKRRFHPPPDEHRRLIEGFLGAIRAGDVASLRSVLAADVVARSDGGGKAFAARRPLRGFDEVSRLYLGLARQITPSIALRIEEVNGAPALIVTENGEARSVIQFAVEEGRIVALDAVINPDKLRFIQSQM